jgi:hypothetical protein
MAIVDPRQSAGRVTLIRNQIIYRDLRRRIYREFRERIGRLASGLGPIGVDQGDVVAILGNGGQVGEVSALVPRFARGFSGSPVTRLRQPQRKAGRHHIRFL